MPATAEFRLSITRALADQLERSLATLSPQPLTRDNIDALPPRAGVYQLYLGDDVVYIGKAESSLPVRLRKHFTKISGRKNIDPTEVGFTCLFVDEDLSAVAPERTLIDRYKAAGLAPWNFNGFGSNDPGQNRDTTVFEKDHFDVRFPAGLDWVCQDIPAGSYVASDLLKRVKKSLPYLFRYQRATFHDRLNVTVPHEAPTADELFTVLGAAIAAYDPKWQIVALPGYVIMYPKNGPFPSARKIYR